MSENFDVNDMTAKFAAELAPAIYKGVVKGIARSVYSTESVLLKNLSEYANKAYETFGQVRTIVCDAPSRLLDIYQPIIFKKDGQFLTEDDFGTFIGKRPQAVVRGYAGAGKSMFLKRQFLGRLQNRKTIPILFELRSINSTYSNLFQHIYEYAHKLLPWLEIEIFRRLLRSGRVELYLDALDEVSHSLRQAVSTAITQLMNEFPDLTIILTTRYGDRYSTPGNIAEFHVQPFTSRQASSLIRSLDFPEEPRNRFANALMNGLFEKSPDLLSNPLLCSIMLLTYRRFAELPDRLHLYYQQAYEVLFSRHDASKEGGYKRDFLSKLDVSQMQGVLDHLSAVTYTSESFTFSESDCVGILAEALSSIGIQDSAADVQDDLVESVSILSRDGIELTFVHRSFQEYFCAHYISNAPGDLAKACIDAVKMRDDTDDVIPMVLALNASRFEEVWLLPSLTEDIEKYNELMQVGKYFDIIREAMPRIYFTGNRILLKPGNGAGSRNFAIFLKLMGSERDHVEVDGAKVVKRLEPASALSAVALFEQYARRIKVPTDFRPRFNGEFLEIDLEDRALSSLAESRFWELLAESLVGQLEQWLGQMQTRKQSREAAPLGAFRRAAALGQRRVEGDLKGPLKTAREGAKQGD